MLPTAHFGREANLERQSEGVSDLSPATASTVPSGSSVAVCFARASAIKGPRLQRYYSFRKYAYVN
jgi:hypothetical protein